MFLLALLIIFPMSLLIVTFIYELLVRFVYKEPDLSILSDDYGDDDC